MLKTMQKPVVWTLSVAAAVLLTAVPAAAQDGPLTVVAPGDLSARTAALYRAQARYPADSWPLEALSPDPLRGEWTPDVQSFGNPDAPDGPELSVWSQKISFEYPGPAVLHASLSPAGDPSSGLAGEVVDAAGFVAGRFSFRDDGEGADRTAGDGVYSARLDFLSRPELADNYLVRVEADLGDGEILHGVGGFTYSRPWARLTGRYRDRLRSGSLVVSAQVEVEQAGRFHLLGAVHGAGGEPLGVAQAAVELDPGRHWIELSFYGLMFHDRQVAGPYRLGSLALSTTGAMPNAKSELVIDAWTTRPYALSDLTSESFARSDLETIARRLEAEAAGAQRRP